MYLRAYSEKDVDRHFYIDDNYRKALSLKSVEPTRSVRGKQELFN
jgi:hypothetical protein